MNFNILGVESLNESLQINLTPREAESIYSIPIGRLLDASNMEIRNEIKEKDNGKEIKDYRIDNYDSGLTIKRMMSALNVKKNADYLKAKKESFDKIVEKGRAKKENITLSYLTVLSLYKKYKKIK